MSGPDPGDVDDSSDNTGESSRHDPHDDRSDGTGDPDHGRAPPPDQDEMTAGGTRQGVPDGARDGNAAARNGRADNGDGAGVSIEDDGVLRWFLKTNDDSAVLVRDVLSSVAIVVVIGLLLFAVSGIWPPLVAVESGSMEPNMEKGDLIFVVADDRFVGDDPAGETGVVTLESGQGNGHEKFGQPGDVIIFEPNGDEFRTPVIHRAHFWVQEDENWVDTKANEEYVNGATCEQLQTCPANHDGFVTKGDANSYYDQYQQGPGAQTDVVQPGWVTGKATFRIPWLGYVRLTFDSILGELVAPQPTIETVSSPLENEAGLSDESAVVGGIGATGAAATGTGVAMAAGRFRRE
ncbi:MULTISPECIES: S26 family signal peptidase [Natrialbaceae]|uniref:S26 family signal peptidase n=1 Tax=Natrialbaceae TaxID=1644061 RepID=UPI00207D3EEC|nr:S26 family signal peptidase [Natronococcus sp. CG52]